MPEYDKTNTFVLFVNDRKNKDDPDDKSADRSGTLNVDGVEYFIDGWIKTGAKGSFLSGRIKPKRQAATTATRKPNPDADIDPDCPF